MKYLHLFNTKSEHNVFIGGDKYKEPWLAYIKDEGHMTYNKDYFTIKALGDGNVTITIPANVNSSYATSISYSKDRSNWTETVIDNTAQTITIPVVTGDKVYLKGIAKQWAKSDSYYTTINSTANINVSGNIMSLLYGEAFIDKTLFPTYSTYIFDKLFFNNHNLIDASKLKFPATTLANNCYNSMFRGCTSLTTAPELPATTLANYCYYQMFYDCTSLTTAPELPATTLANSCYSSMFRGCTSLTTAPELPATTLANICYQYMFYGCTSLTTAPELPATTLATYCYSSMFYGCTSLTTAPELPATTLVNNCYSIMFQGCTSLTTAPELPATTLATYCYSIMFQGCTSLTTAPELPATTLVNNCYYQMFRGCSKINYIKAMFTTTPSTSYTYNWVNGVKSTGTFVKNNAATWNVTGTNGVPSGWNVQTASA